MLEAINQMFEGRLSWQRSKWRSNIGADNTSFSLAATRDHLSCCVERMLAIQKDPYILLHHLPLEKDRQSYASVVSSITTVVNNFIASSLLSAVAIELELFTLKKQRFKIWKTPPSAAVERKPSRQVTAQALIKARKATFND